jgi:anaerobic magnesium-protoporphyrin IX monomethyl ester cyclase
MKPRKRQIILFYPEDEEGFAWHPFCYHLLAPILGESGYEPIVIDQRVEADWKERLESCLGNALWIGFTLISGVMIKHALEVAHLVKDVQSDLPVVFGGWHPTCLPKQTLEHPLVDYVVVGPGDSVVVELSKYFEGKITQIPMRTFGKENLAELTDDTTGFEAVKPLTQYNWRLGYQLIPEMDLYRSKRNIAAIFSAISCPYGRCNFCSIVSMYRYIPRQIDDVLEEIHFLLQERNFSSINFHDGLFFTNPKAVMPLIKGFRNREYKFIWKAKTRANGLQRFSQEDLKMIRETGCEVIAVGIESGSEYMLNKMKKGTKPQDAFELLRICNDFGIEVQTTYMSGLPGDKTDYLKITIEQIEKLKSLYPNFYFSSFFYLPAPGTEAYNEFVSTGGRVPNSLEGWSNVKWREPNKINKLHWLNPKEGDEFMRTYFDYFEKENKAKRVSWSHKENI